MGEHARISGRIGGYHSPADRLRRVLALHFHPQDGTSFWLERAAAMQIDVEHEVRRMEDLVVLGDMRPEDLAGRPLTDFIPRRFHHRMDRFIVGQTGGTTGNGVWTAYRDDEFQEAFVFPFVEAAGHVGFPAGEAWLFVGPSGPHIIGKVVRHLAGALGSADPFSVDFDSRWAKLLPDGSFARDRYVRHVVAQAMAVIDTQPIGVLFTTPAILSHLASAMSRDQRERIRGVHYGGMAITTHELARFQQETFPNAIHLCGYGNTLFGCCLELSTVLGRELDYFPYGDRLFLELVDADGIVVPPGTMGRVRFTRLDESMLIVRMLERDEAVGVAAPQFGPECFQLPGIRNPVSSAKLVPELTVGLY